MNGLNGWQQLSSRISDWLGSFAPGTYANPLLPLSHALKAVPIRVGWARVDGFSYSVSLRRFSGFSDNSNEPERSTLLILEDGHVVGPPHATHDTIRNVGMGAYSHWGNRLIFSASDNSDPCTNGRHYQAVIVKQVKALDEAAVGVLTHYFQHGLTVPDQVALVSSMLDQTYDRRHYFADPLRDAKEFALTHITDQLANLYGGSVNVFMRFRAFRDLIQQHLGTLDGLVVGEIGPGRHAGLGLLLHMAGARQYLSVEAFRDPHWNDAATLRNVMRLAAVYYPELDQARGNAAIDETASSEASLVFQEDAISEVWHDGSSETLPLASASADVLLSVSVMEHVRHPQAFIDEMERVLRPGGVAIHLIDLAEHKPLPADGRFDRLDFLRYSQQEWDQKWDGQDTAFYTNRWRQSQFVDAFEQSGFTVLDVRANEQLPTVLLQSYLLREELARLPGLTPEMKAGFDPFFQQLGDDDLSALVTLVVAQKKV